MVCSTDNVYVDLFTFEKEQEISTDPEVSGIRRMRVEHIACLFAGFSFFHSEK